MTLRKVMQTPFVSHLSREHYCQFGASDKNMEGKIYTDNQPEERKEIAVSGTG